MFIISNVYNLLEMSNVKTFVMEEYARCEIFNLLYKTVWKIIEKITVQSGNIAHIKLWWSFVTLSMTSHKKHNQTCSNTSLKINSDYKMPLRMILFTTILI